MVFFCSDGKSVPTPVGKVIGSTPLTSTNFENHSGKTEWFFFVLKERASALFPQGKENPVAERSRSAGFSARV